MQKYFWELCLGVILGLGDIIYSMYIIKIIMYMERPIEHGNRVCVCVCVCVCLSWTAERLK